MKKKKLCSTGATNLFFSFFFFFFILADFLLNFQNDVESAVCLPQSSNLFIFWSLRRFGFDQDKLMVVCKGYVRLVIEYANVIWHSGLTDKKAGDSEYIDRELHVELFLVVNLPPTAYTESSSVN